ncbi:MAG: tetratricopeptide repeat protein [Microbacter sp.]
MDELDDDFFFDDESAEIVRRYEESVNERNMPYFDVEEVEVIADYYLSCGKTKESFNVIDLGLKLHPNNTSLQTKRAKAYLESGDVRKAYQILERNALPYDADSLLLKGDALMRLHRPKEAVTVFDRMMTLPGIDFETASLDIAYICVANNEFTDALHFLNLGMEHAPDNLDILEEAAFCYEQLNQNDQAIEMYQRIIEVDPYSSEAWYDLGLIFFSRSLYDQALDAFDFVTVIDEEDTGGWLQKGNSLFHLNRFREALVCYHRCQSLMDFEDLLLIFMAQCHEKLEEYAQAASYYAKAVEINEKNIEGWIGMGICALELEQYDAACQHLQKGLELDPENSEAWVYLAESYINRNEPLKAIDAYKESLQLSQDQAETWQSLGTLYLETKKYVNALDAFLMAERLTVDDIELPNLKLFLAVAFCKTGDMKMARQFLSKAVTANLEAKDMFREFCPECESWIVQED